ncbi:MAG: glycosyltransferase [Promethearchaeota archaeon]|nr:MAG: glycosyltransferase [Candidatus Lokiarchaeota archaeon]
MNILILQETDWIHRGPHTQHHIFERLSTLPQVNIIVLDYDIDKRMRSKTLLVKERKYNNIHKVINTSKISIIRTSHLQIPYLRRISALITNFFKILKIFRNNKPDIVISFALSNGLLGFFLSKLFNIPYLFFYIDILHELVPIEFAKNLAKILTLPLLNYSDQIIVHTEIQKKYLENMGAQGNKIEISPDGISLENTIVNSDKLLKLKNKFSIKEKDFVIFFMGYLYEFAGLKEIIDYYDQKVKKGELNLRFLILGDGGIYPSLKKYIEKLNAQWVILAGRVPFNDITEYIELADLCLLSFAINDITKEITPIKIIEYMAMKKPVLSTALPGVISQLGYNSSVIFTEDQETLIKRIEDLVSQKERLKNLGREGYDLVKNEFTWEKIIKDFKTIMFKTIKNSN